VCALNGNVLNAASAELLPYVKFSLLFELVFSSALVNLKRSQWQRTLYEILIFLSKIYCLVLYS